MDDKQDPTKLTSFHPLTPVSSSNGFSLSRIFEFGRRKTSRTPKLPATPEQSRKLSAEETRKQTITEENVNINAASSSKIDGHDKKENFYSWLTESVTSQAKLYGGKEPPCEVRLTQSETQTPRKEKWRYRNVRTILRRLSALTIDRRWHQSTGDFKHNFKQYWMPDEHCKECYECGEKFNTFRRRHHCRVCGQIFCYRCCNEEVPGKIIGFSGDIRVCNYCYKIVQAYLNDDLEKSIEALSEDIKAFDPNYGYEFGGSTSSLCSLKSGLHFDDSSYRVKRTGSCSSIANNGANERSPTPVQRSPFDAFGVAPSEANQIKQLQDYLTELWCHITNSKTGVELASHRYKLKTYHNCFAGSELVDWMVKNNKASTRTQAQFTGQALLDNNWIELVCPYEQNVFKDEYMLYQPTETALLETETASMAAQLHATSANYSGDSSVERKFSELDDDDQAPKWFKQLSSITPLDENDLGHSVSVLSQSKRFSAGRHLNLDHVTAEDTDVKKADLSLQMNLDTQRLDNVKREMNVDEASKISFITHVPPLPLDTYVCVEGHQSAMKKKVVKPSNPVISEDILRGVVFPRPNTEPEAQGENSDDFGNDESGERLARERLSYATFHHVNALMKQLLRQDNLLPTWEEIIMPFISKISDQVVPDVRRDDDMDIRRYVWFTKVPGGLKKDSHLISGVVFCKNISHKRMADYFLQPKILMMSCAIEYQRVENKMSSLDPLVLQEHAFLQNFVKRILALKPNILLVEKNVARVAQDMLLAGGVTLVHNIKPSIMENIARCTGADILSTMEQVTRPRFGTCQQFRLQKYPLPKTKESKTLMYFDGCAPDLGCSLILRGGNEKTLLKIKKIIKYLIYVSYHLKLENKFLMDEFSMPPPLEQLTPQLYQSLTHPQQIDDTTTSNEPVSCDVIREAENSVASVEVAESDKFADALNRIILTSSPFCNYFMPYLLTEDGKVCPSRQFIAPRVYWSRYLDGSVSEPLTLAEDDHEWVENQELISPGTIVKPPHPFTDPSKLLDCIENSEQRASLLNDFRARGGRIDLKMYHKYEERESQRVYGKYWKKLSAVTVDLEEDCKEEEALEDDIAIELTPDPKHDCFDAYNHQKMAVLFSSYPSESRAPKPCITPWAVYMEFYGRNDITLGGFLERYCFRPSYICPSPHCSVPMVNHVRYFAHGKGSLYIHMRNLESPIPGYDRTILTWSWCKICKQVTPVVPLSFESYSISFAKYLELRFYGSQYTRRASAEPCGHSLHHDHYQYFSYGNMVASFKYGAIDLYEVILPSDDIVVGKKRHSQTLVNEVEDIYAKVESFPKIIMDRLNGLKSADPQPFSASREAKIKEFITDLQKEQSNLQDCVRVIKKKADALVKKMSISDGTDSKSSDGTSFRSETNQLESLKSNSTSAIPSSAEAARENVTTVDLNDDEKYLLTIDIGNKLFHLKKSMCESVENWNLKLQEFITQDRKREKTVVRSASPVKQPNFPTDITEFYPDLTRVEMDPARPKMLNRETVSEVYLTGGKILRQTYFGNTPSPHPGDSGDTELPAQVRKTSGQIASSRKVSESNLSTTSKDRKDLTLPLTSGQETSAANTSFDKTESERNKVGSPYMLISSLKESVKNSPEDVNSDLKKDSLESKNDEAINVGNILPTKLDNETVQSSNIEASHSQDINVVMDLDVTKPPIDITSETKCSDGDPIDNWVSQGDHITPVRSESIFHSDSEMSLGVEYSSDQDDLSDNQSMLTEDDQDPNLPESEVQSEVEIAEEENDIFEDSIQLGESAVDFVDRALSPNGSVKKDTSKAGIPIAHKKSISVEIPSPLASHSPVTTTQVTSGITNNSATKQKITKSGGSSISITKLPAFTEFPKFRKEEKVEKIEYLTPKEVKAMQVARRRRTEWEYRSRKPANSSEIVTAPKVSVSSKEPLPIKDDHFSKLKSTAKQKSVKESPTMKHSSANNRKSNPLIKRLVQNALESTEGKKKGKVTPVKQVTAKNKRYSIQSLFKPIKVDKNTEGDHPLSPDKLEEQDHAVEKPTENKAAVSSMDAKPLSNYQKRKMMGHRRMKSAPLRVAPKEEECIPSEVTPESPYVYLNPMDQDVVRERSRSLGNKHVYKEAKQLSKMAELVCHEDRVDAERDVPEVVQYNSNPTTNITSIAGITYIVNQQILQNADDKRPFDETAKKVAKPDTDVPDASKLTSGTGEAATVNRRGGSEKMKKMIANWLPGVNFQPIPRPFPSSEQYMPQVNGTSFIVINEKEPTSLIAFTLSSQDYSNQLQNIQDMMAGKKVTNMLLQRTLSSQPNTPSLSRKQVGIDERIGSNSPTIINNPSEASVILRNNISFQSLRPRSWAAPNDGIDETDCFSGDNTNADSPVLKRVAGVGKRHPLASVELDPIMDSLEVDDSVSCDDVLDGSESVKSGEDVNKKKEEKSFLDYHIKLQFQNNVAKFYCSVYYAEQFRQLRELIFPEGEERFIQSLARCMFWKATGGKSGSSFSKSLDDRFVMKQMSRLEVQSFVDFAPRYFSYINKAIKEKRPTAMAKLLGVYRIGFKNSVTNTTMRQDVLVMENLFYERKVNKIFDLKGSVRGRYVQTSVKEDVLMDENLLEMISESPLFIRAHSKAVLSKAIYNDTEFLSTNLVMDYSLLVGIDKTNCQLVVGIIDYIRTYTWDKKLESYVKSTGILGGQGKMPTVISPDAYRDRYTQAMQRYFLMVPDKWTGFGADLNLIG